jgi:hypothetical protein
MLISRYVLLAAKRRGRLRSAGAALPEAWAGSRVSVSLGMASAAGRAVVSAPGLGNPTALGLSDALGLVELASP